MKISCNLKRGKQVLFLLLVFLLYACDFNADTENAYPFYFTDSTMGTRFSVKASHLPENITSDKLQIQISSLLTEINQQMSTYLIDSEISKFNQHKATEWYSLSEELFSVIKQAQMISEITDGAFDITVGPLVNLWGFGPDGMQFEQPDADLLKLKMNHIGHKHLSLRDSTKSIKKHFAEIYLDLSALAKGYAVDKVAELLENNGIHHFLVEIGGEIRLKGNNAGSKPWRIAIERPIANQRTIQKVVTLTDISMATSGDYRNYFEQEGKRFSHTLDPRTGQPINHKLASVTILRTEAMEADALATALMVLGPDAGFQLAEQQNLAVLFIIKSADGFNENSTSSFKEYLR